jgi:hypothetical protein
MLGIIGHNFDGGRHTKLNFGSYWLSDLGIFDKKYDDQSYKGNVKTRNYTNRQNETK